MLIHRAQHSADYSIILWGEEGGGEEGVAFFLFCCCFNFFFFGGYHRLLDRMAIMGGGLQQTEQLIQ